MRELRRRIKPKKGCHIDGPFCGLCVCCCLFPASRKERQQLASSNDFVQMEMEMEMEMEKGMETEKEMENRGAGEREETLAT